MAAKFFGILNNFDAILTRPKMQIVEVTAFYLILNVFCHFRKIQMSKHQIWMRLMIFLWAASAFKGSSIHFV